MRPNISPVRSTILALKKSPTQKKKTRIPCIRHRCGAGQIPSEGQVRNILSTLECQRGVNYAYLDAKGHQNFYSSGVLPPFLVAQVVSLQNSSFRNPKRGGQVILLWKVHGLKVFSQDSSNALPYSYWALILSGVPHKGLAQLSLGPWTQTRQAHSSRPVRPCLLFLSSSAAPFTPFGPSLFVQGEPIGVTVKVILTIRCSWG